ncbi:hypothetical protein C8R43DRAFT_1133440 [Mycena crocata]|nr:hypothetical protein C8R43DRAFT_1133440 [Mycena crocata]
MLRTATLVARRPLRPPRLALTRPLSAAAHTHEHHHEQDDFVYPKEGFHGLFWTQLLIWTALGTAFYEFLGAPLDNTKPWTPFVFQEPLKTATRRAVKEAALLEQTQLVRSAQRAPIYRSRNPEEFNHVSGYMNPVGQGVKWTGPPDAATSFEAALAEAEAKFKKKESSK